MFTAQSMTASRHFKMPYTDAGFRVMKQLLRALENIEVCSVNSINENRHREILYKTRPPQKKPEYEIPFEQIDDDEKNWGIEYDETIMAQQRVLFESHGIGADGDGREFAFDVKMEIVWNNIKTKLSHSSRPQFALPENSTLFTQALSPLGICPSIADGFEGSCESNWEIKPEPIVPESNIEIEIRDRRESNRYQPSGSHPVHQRKAYLLPKADKQQLLQQVH